MKYIYVSIIAATILFTACNNAPTGEAAEVKEAVGQSTSQDGEAYDIVGELSSVTFVGATPSHTQTGMFPVSSGTISLDGDQLAGAKVTILFEDVTITSEKLPEDKKEELKAHLLNKDFFNTEINKEVVFETTSVSTTQTDEETPAIEISGDLRMNGKTKNITFPAQVTITDDKVNATANFVINRKDWGIVHGDDKSLGDKWIYDEVKMSFDITANK